MHRRDPIQITAHWRKARNLWPRAQGAAMALHRQTGSGGARGHYGVAQSCHTQHIALAGMLADSIAIHRGVTHNGSTTARVVT